MIDHQPLYQLLQDAGAADWATQIANRLEDASPEQSHGDWFRWQQAVDSLPSLCPSVIDVLNAVQVGCENDILDAVSQQLLEGLQALHPWRKGPYQLFGVHIDTEWRSDWKWDRLKHHIAPLQNRLVLDIGCGNGYHCWRMWGSGARAVIGVDPTLLSVMQFRAVRKLHGEAPVYVLPLGVEDLPSNLKLFDTVFSMGVLYHRRSPIDHLLELKGLLRPGGELILETLVIDGESDRVLLPEQRYAQMRNVWFLPSCLALMGWMKRCGFKNIRLCNVAKTTSDEQRSTEWMRFNSLKDFLDPKNEALTCEGLPAPVRAIFIANNE